MADKYYYMLTLRQDGYEFSSSIEEALSAAEAEIVELRETIDSVRKLKPDCDKLDYALSAGIGALCGVLDIFLVGKPEESPLGDLSDKWFEDRVQDFARLVCPGKNNDTPAQAIQNLGLRFKVPYDQRGAGDAGKEIFKLNPYNHHFKSLAHNPTLLGLFFSVLDQFANTSHFVADGQLIELEEADGKFELHGKTLPAKLFCGAANWFGHLMSDVAGSPGSKGRGMGIPSPIWAWVNDAVVICEKLNMPGREFRKNLGELAVKVYTEGFDLRFQTAQVIPVLVNELLIRLVYSLRRMFSYAALRRDGQIVGSMWEYCSPFGNPTVERMLTVAHGMFLLFDAGDATIHAVAVGAGTFNAAEFFLRLNIAGVGRFSVCLYEEGKRAVLLGRAKREAEYAQRLLLITERYLEGLRQLAEKYDDRDVVALIRDYCGSELYREAFEQTAVLAEKRGVPKTEILRSMQDIDGYFMGGKK